MNSRLKIEHWPISKLAPYERNTRTHTGEQIAQIAASIAEFGFVNPILVGPDGVIIAGHGRLLAARKLGMSSVPVVVLDHLSEAQRRALVIADNKLALNAGWDDELLAAELRALEDLHFDLDVVGFSDAEIEFLMKQEAAPTMDAPEADVDHGQELRDKWHTEEGQTWIIGEHRLRIGDARLLPAEQTDGVCTDPPYEMPADQVAGIVSRFSRQSIIMGGDRQILELSRLLEPHFLLIWKKKTPRMIGAGARTFPIIYHAAIGVFSDQWRRPSRDFPSVIEIEAEYDTGGFGYGKHPDIFVKMLEGFPWKTVADPFAGSCPMILAAEALRRRCVATELDPAVAAIGLQRCADFGLEPRLAAPSDTSGLSPRRARSRAR